MECERDLNVRMYVVTQAHGCVDIWHAYICTGRHICLILLHFQSKMPNQHYLSSRCKCQRLCTAASPYACALQQVSSYAHRLHSKHAMRSMRSMRGGVCYVCMYPDDTYIHTYIYTQWWADTYVLTYMSIYAYAHIHTHFWMCVGTHTYTCIHVFKACYACMYISKWYMHTFIHVHRYTCTYTCCGICACTSTST
jgi:hypothetical protein